MAEPITLNKSIDAFFEYQQEFFSSNTQRAYRKALEVFLESLKPIGINSGTKLSEITSESLDNFVKYIKELSPSTQHVYLQAILTWRKFVSNKYDINVIMNTSGLFRILPKIRKAPKSNKSEFHAISRIITYTNGLSNKSYKSNKEYLQALRDKAIILLLADTGLDVSIIPTILKNDIDVNNKRLSLNMKGDLKTTSLSPRVIEAISDYLEKRRPIDNLNTRSAKLLPLFARHDKGSGKKILNISPTTIRNIVKQRAEEALGLSAREDITPISFRHYFISTISQSFSSFHPKIAGKCRIYFDTGLYDDAIFNAMKIVEDEVRKKALLANTDYGVNLISNAMSPKAPIIIFSTMSAEQEAAHNLFRGALGSFKNPLSHRFLDTDDPVKTFEILSLASLLMRMLDEVR